MGLDTSSSVRTSAWLLSYERYHEHNDYMSVLHAKFDVKTVMNEEITVNEWQKKIKYQSWQKCCLFYKVLKFWLTCVYGTSCSSCTSLKFPHNPAFFTINFRHFLFFSSKSCLKFLGAAYLRLRLIHELKRKIKQISHP